LPVTATCIDERDDLETDSQLESDVTLQVVFVSTFTVAGAYVIAGRCSDVWSMLKVLGIPGWVTVTTCVAAGDSPVDENVMVAVRGVVDVLGCAETVTGLEPAPFGDVRDSQEWSDGIAIHDPVDDTLRVVVAASADGTAQVSVSVDSCGSTWAAGWVTVTVWVRIGVPRVVVNVRVAVRGVLKRLA